MSCIEAVEFEKGASRCRVNKNTWSRLLLFAPKPTECLFLEEPTIGRFAKPRVRAPIVRACLLDALHPERVYFADPNNDCAYAYLDVGGEARLVCGWRVLPLDPQTLGVLRKRLRAPSESPEAIFAKLLVGAC